METLTIETQPTANKNVSYLKARVGNFDLIGIKRGLSLWVEMFNPNNSIVDTSYVQINGTDWTDWPAGLTDEQDYEYVSAIILKKLGLSKRLKAPYFVDYPASQEVIQGSDAVFFGNVKGYPEDFSYLWFYNDVEIVGVTGNMLWIDNVQLSNTGTYLLKVSNSEGFVEGSAYLSVLQKAAPTIINQPLDITINSGQYGQLSVLANGVPNPTYQWFKDGAELQNETSTSLVFYPMEIDKTGYYSVTATNTEGSATSNVVAVNVNTNTDLNDQFVFAP